MRLKGITLRRLICALLAVLVVGISACHRSDNQDGSGTASGSAQ